MDGALRSFNELRCFSHRRQLADNHLFILDRDIKISLVKLEAVLDRVDVHGTHHPHPDPPPSRGREYKRGAI